MGHLEIQKDLLKEAPLLPGALKYSMKKKRNNQLVKKKLQKITDSAKTNENLMPLTVKISEIS